ncbi:MAG TPA: RNA 2',3'-cyclic phosphodiesterase [Mycobacteriales bacterium]|nr:RNA 2',3'-cyclic phosphodiesterase [Mycobacteriales bacterium]
MRLFAAIDPPNAERERLLTWLAAARLEATDLRLTPSDQWHITLAFYGETPGGSVAELTERLRRTAQRSDAPSVQLRGVGSFPADPARAKVLWVGLDGDLPQLSRLADRCVAAGRRTGLDVDARTFRGHLTIGRPRREPVDLRPVLAALPPYVGEPWLATTVRLVRSHLGAQVRHETLEEIPLD